MTRWIAHRLIDFGATEARLIGLFAGTTALLSLFMNNLAAGALLLPSAMEVARRTGIRPSMLLIPVAYGSLLGGAATYFTTANIIVSDLLRIAEPPQAPLRVYDFTPTGGLIALLTQVMGGQVSALVTGPVAISAAIGMVASPQAIAVATAIGCSASFLTPFAHPVNILMIAPANYTFRDFFHIGWRLTLISFAMLLVGMVLFWRL